MSARKLGKCLRCGAPATEQFSICANGGVWTPVCKICDIALNAVVLDFMKIPNAAKKIVAYIAEKA